MGRKPGTKQVSVTADSARPGGPSTMDALMAWITKPGNVKRWRSEPRAPLIREIVDKMHSEGLVHRKAPFVRYKVDDIEKKYLLAKQWLLETGMHDAYMRGKATPEVRAHVERTCPLFRKLDPAFHGVPFSKKNAETIELDDSAEDGESAEESKQEIEVPDSDSEGDDEDDENDDDEEGDDSEDDENEGSSSVSDSDGAASEEVYDGEEEVEEARDEEVATKKGKKKAAAAEAAIQKASTPSRFKELLLARTAEAEKASEPKKAKKKATLKEKVLVTTPEKAKAVVKEKKKAPTSVEKQKKKVVVSKERVLLKVDEKKTKKKAVASKERVLLKVGAKEKSPARSQKKADNAETPASATTAKTSKDAEKKKADSDETRVSAPATKVAEKKKKTSKPAEPQEKKTASKSKEPPVLSSAVEAALEQVAPSKSKPEAVESTPEPVKKRRGRPPKSATAASPATNDMKETTPKANGKKPLKASATKRKAAEEETAAVKTTPTVQKEAETATKRARTQQQGEESAAKRARTQEQDEAERKTMVAIEREALLKRVEDEQKQRHDVYELERSKLQCELAAKQVQLLFEKATARKKLDQLGVPQEEIDRLLPL